MKIVNQTATRQPRRVKQADQPVIKRRVIRVTRRPAAATAGDPTEDTTLPSDFLPLDQAIAACDQITAIHPACDALPLIDAVSFRQLCEAINKDGQLEPIRVDAKGQLLDGRCRLSACFALSIAPAIEVSTDDPWAIAMSNVARRHLTAGQRALVAVQLLQAEQTAAQERKRANLKIGQATPDRRNSGIRGRAAKIAGKRVGVSADSVAKAAKLPEDLQRQVMSGEKSLHAASQLAASGEDKVPTAKKRGKGNNVARSAADADGIITQYRGGAVLVLRHKDHSCQAVIIGPHDGKWRVQITESTKTAFFSSAEPAEQLARRELVRRLGQQTEQSTSQPAKNYRAQAPCLTSAASSATGV